MRCDGGVQLLPFAFLFWQVAPRSASGGWGNATGGGASRDGLARRGVRRGWSALPVGERLEEERRSERIWVDAVLGCFPFLGRPCCFLWPMGILRPCPCPCPCPELSGPSVLNIRLPKFDASLRCAEIKTGGEERHASLCGCWVHAACWSRMSAAHGTFAVCVLLRRVSLRRSICAAAEWCWIRLTRVHIFFPLE